MSETSLLPFAPERLYSLEAVGEILALAPSTVREIVAREGLTRFRLGHKTVRLAGAELVALLERSKARAGATSLRRSAP